MTGATPGLRGIAGADDPNDVPDGYPAAIVWEGLGLLPFHVVVHHRSGDADAAPVEEEIAFYEREGSAYRTLRDGQVLVVPGSLDRLRLVG